MDARGGAAAEGPGTVLLAVVAGGVAFPCWLVAPFGPGPLGVSGFWPSAYPPTIEFVRWAGAGVIGGMVSACIAPRRRRFIVPPLLVLLEMAWPVFVFLMVGAGDVPVPQGTFSGMSAGVIVGVAAVAFCRPGLRPARRFATIALAVALLLVTPAVSAWRGRADLVAMRESVLPAVATLLRADVLTLAAQCAAPERGQAASKTSPIQWIALQRKLSREGCVYWSAYGEMSSPKAQIALEWRHPSPSQERIGGLEAFRADGLGVQLAAPPSLDAIELDRRHDADEVKRVLHSMGVRPELAARIVLRKQPEAANYYAVARYHGISYEFDWHTFVSYLFRRMQFPVSSMLIRCSGSYSAPAR